MDSAASSSYFHSLSLDQVLDDLSSRFIVNLPAEELESIERICFQIEQAHWYYEDFVRPQASHLPSYSLRKFSEIIFRTNPLLSHYDAVSAYDHFMRYKERVPVCGAILLTSSMEKCLVVRGWKSGASWSFPRGKINQGEEERDCAVREVWEETGYDISPHFNSQVLPHHPESHSCPPLLPAGEYADDDYLECVMKEQRIRLYIVPDVPEDTLFETKTRKEISKIAWAPLTSLPTWSKNKKPDKKDLKCYMVTPFVNPLKSWIKARKNPSKKQQKGRKAVAEPLEPVAIVEEEEDSAVVGSMQDVLPPEPSSAGLLEQSRALQALFFGESAPLEEPQPSYEPSTSAAGRLPSPPSNNVSAHSHTLLQSLNNAAAAAAPLPASPHRNDSLNRLLGIRSVETASSAQSPSTMPGYTTAAQSTVMPTSPRYQGFSSSVTPSYSDYRNSALSPSGFANTRNGPIPPPLVRAPGPTYTEEEREKARNQLLLNLAAQLGTGPTPPSADDDSFEEDEEEAEDQDDQRENPKADKQSPAVELLQLFQAQLQDDAARGPLQAPRLTKQALNDLQQAQYARPEQSAHTPERAASYQLPLHSPQPQATPQSQNAMLNILNGLIPPAASQSPRSPLAQQQSVPQATSPNVSYNSVPPQTWSEGRPQEIQQPAAPSQHTQAGHNPHPSLAVPMAAESANSRPADVNGKPQAAQASALLSLINAPKTALSPTQSATPTNNVNGKADLLRLFANAKVTQKGATS